MDEPSGRTRHYGAFYGLPEVPVPGADGRDVLVVYGNCQAESVRVLLELALGDAVTAVRIPPVFELTEADLPALTTLLSRTRYLVTQPVRPDYRDLPLGTAQVSAQLPPGATVLRWPVLRYSGLLPFQAIIRDPLDPGSDPPGVPYHDLRTLASAATGIDRFDVDLDPAAIRDIAHDSRAELGRRETRDCDVGISDLLDPAQAGDWATINHPGNRVLIGLVERILAAVSLSGQVRDPGRVLLGEVVSPADPRVETTMDVRRPGDARRAALDGSWRVGPQAVSAQEIHRLQRDWYADRPQLIRAGFDRHAATLARLGLTDSA